MMRHAKREIVLWAAWLSARAWPPGTMSVTTKSMGFSVERPICDQRNHVTRDRTSSMTNQSEQEQQLSLNSLFTLQLITYCSSVVYFAWDWIHIWIKTLRRALSESSKEDMFVFGQKISISDETTSSVSPTICSRVENISSWAAI